MHPPAFPPTHQAGFLDFIAPGSVLRGGFNFARRTVSSDASAAKTRLLRAANLLTSTVRATKRSTFSAHMATALKYYEWCKKERFSPLPFGVAQLVLFTQDRQNVMAQDSRASKGGFSAWARTAGFVAITCALAGQSTTNLTGSKAWAMAESTAMRETGATQADQRAALTPIMVNKAADFAMAAGTEPLFCVALSLELQLAMGGRLDDVGMVDIAGTLRALADDEGGRNLIYSNEKGASTGRKGAQEKGFDVAATYEKSDKTWQIRSFSSKTSKTAPVWHDLGRRTSGIFERFHVWVANHPRPETGGWHMVPRILRRRGKGVAPEWANDMPTWWSVDVSKDGVGSFRAILPELLVRSGACTARDMSGWSLFTPHSVRIGADSAMCAARGPDSSEVAEARRIAAKQGGWTPKSTMVDHYNKGDAKQTADLLANSGLLRDNPDFATAPRSTVAPAHYMEGARAAGETKVETAECPTEEGGNPIPPITTWPQMFIGRRLEVPWDPSESGEDSETSYSATATEVDETDGLVSVFFDNGQSMLLTIMETLESLIPNDGWDPSKRPGRRADVKLLDAWAESSWEPPKLRRRGLVVEVRAETILIQPPPPSAQVFVVTRPLRDGSATGGPGWLDTWHDVPVGTQCLTLESSSYGDAVIPYRPRGITGGRPGPLPHEFWQVSNAKGDWDTVWVHARVSPEDVPSDWHDTWTIWTVSKDLSSVLRYWSWRDAAQWRPFRLPSEDTGGAADEDEEKDASSTMARPVGKPVAAKCNVCQTTIALEACPKSPGEFKKRCSECHTKWKATRIGSMLSQQCVPTLPSPCETEGPPPAPAQKGDFWEMY